MRDSSIEGDEHTPDMIELGCRQVHRSTTVNGSRNLTPLRQMKIDPPAPGRSHAQWSIGVPPERDRPRL